jgi:hypothetical protein
MVHILQHISFYSNLKLRCVIWGAHGGDYEYFCLLVYDVVQSGTSCVQLYCSNQVMEAA